MNVPILPSGVPASPTRPEPRAKRQAVRVLSHVSTAMSLSQPLDCAAWLLLFAFVQAVLWPLASGRDLYWGDISLYFDPMWRLAKHELLAGRVPLWNPRTLGGQPLLGNPQMGVFYPPTLILPWLSVGRFLAWMLIGHLWLSGGFTYLFLRGQRYSRTAALCGGLVFAGSGCLLGRLQFPPMVFTACYLPLLLWLVERGLGSGRLSVYLTLALVVGGMVLAGHPQIAYLNLVLALTYGFFRLTRLRVPSARPGLPPTGAATEPRGDREERSLPVSLLRGRAIMLLGAGLLGCGLAAVQVVPALQLLVLSPREGLSAAQANRFHLPFPQLITLLLPRFYGHPASRDYWGAGNAWEPDCFVGWLPLLAGGWAVWNSKKGSDARWWAFVGAVGVWLAIGNAGGLFWLAFRVVPGLANFHDPARFLYLTVFALTVLTGAGVNALIASHRSQMDGGPSQNMMSRAKPPRLLSAMLVLLTAMPLWWYGRDWNPTLPPGREQTARALGRRHSSAVLPRWGREYLPAHDVYWRTLITEGYADWGDDSLRARAAFHATRLPNLNLTDEAASASGYEPVPIAATTELDGLARTALKQGEPNFPDLVALLGVSRVLLPSSVHLTLPEQPSSGSGQNFPAPIASDAASGGMVTGYATDATGSETWLVGATRLVEGKMRTAAALADPNFRERQTALITPAPGAPPDHDRTVGALGSAPAIGTVERERTSSQGDLTLTTHTGVSGAFLIVAQTAYPGWTATLDGHPTALLRVDGALMGLPVPTGDHRVEIAYRPHVVRVGAYLTLLSCLLLALAAGFLLVSQVSANRRARRHQDETARYETEPGS